MGTKIIVSQLCSALDVRVRAWNERPLSEHAYSFKLVDALVIKVRRDEAVRSTSGLIVSGVNKTGYRKLLGLRRIFESPDQSEVSPIVKTKIRPN